MAKSADDTSWLDELANSRDQELEPEEQDHQEQAQDDLAKGEHQEEPKPEAKQDDGDEVRTVPLATFLEERNQLNAKIDRLQQQLEEGGKSLAQLSKLEEQIRDLREARKEHQETAPPDYLDDPQGYVDSKTQSVAEQLKALGDKVDQSQQASQKTEQEIQQQRMVQQVATLAASADQDFVKEHPDYYDALEHMRSIRRQQIQLTAPQATKEQIEQFVRTEEFNIAAQVISQGRNSAEYGYEMAKTMGYTPRQADQDDKAQDDDARMAEGREKAQGMGSGGTPPGGDIEELMGMGDDEFDQAMKEMFGR